MKGEEVWEDKPEIEKEAEVSKRIMGGLVIMWTPPGPHLGSRGKRDVLLDPGHVAHHSGIHPREVTMTTDISPAHDPHLDPGAIPATHQGAPRVTLWGETELRGATAMELLRLFSWARRGQRMIGRPQVSPGRNPGPHSQHTACRP